MLVVGDLHFDYPVRYSAGGGNIYFSAVRDVLRYVVVEVAEEGESVVFLGDIFERKDRILNRVKNSLIEVLEEGMDKGLSYWFVVGNHDVGEGGEVSVRFLSWIGRVVDEVGVYEIEGTRVLFLPWVSGKIRVGECDLVLGHFRVQGGRAGEFIDSGEECYKVSDFRNVRGWIVDGHYHDRQVVDDRICVVGSVVSVRFGERNDKYVVRVSGGGLEWISLPRVLDREVVYVRSIDSVDERLVGKVVRFDVEIGKVDTVELVKRIEEVRPLWWELNFVRREVGDELEKLREVQEEGSVIEGLDGYVRGRLEREVLDVVDREVWLKLWEEVNR